MSVGSPSPGPRPSPLPGPRPTSAPAADPSSLLASVDDEIARLDEQDVTAQVETYHRLHTTLTDALARTTDAGPPRPGP